MEHILAIVGSEYLNIENNTQMETQMIVSQEVIDWLDQHDVEYTSERDKIFICNKIRYRYVGLYVEPQIIPLAAGGEA